MGLLRDIFGGGIERDSSTEILRDKIPPVKGLSAETADAVERGDLEIVDDDEE